MAHSDRSDLGLGTRWLGLRLPGLDSINGTRADYLVLGVISLISIVWQAIFLVLCWKIIFVHFLYCSTGNDNVCQRGNFHWTTSNRPQAIVHTRRIDSNQLTGQVNPNNVGAKGKSSTLINTPPNASLLVAQSRP